jgi:hypothetical protein
MYLIQKNTAFQIIAIVAIFLNSVVLSLSRYPIDYEFEEFLDKLNIGFYFFFLIELFVKLVASGVNVYFRDRYNWYDFGIVVLGAIELALIQAASFIDTGRGAITALRLLRLLRVFRLAKYWKEFQQLLIAIQKTIKDISNISILQLLFVFTFMQIGMDMFAYKAKFNRYNELDFSDKG